ATPGQPDHDDLALLHVRGLAQRPGYGMRGLEGGHDAFETRQSLEGLESLRVGGRLVLKAAAFLVVGVLGAGAGIVEPGRDGVRLGDLPVVVLEHVAHAPVEHSDRARAQRGAMTPRGEAVPTRLDAHDAHAAIRDEGPEEPDGVGAAAYAGDD